MIHDDTIERIVEASKDSGLIKYLIDQREWSLKTFGPGTRTEGIVEHIRKELEEILKKPYDPLEWIDVLILALDGYWRHGHPPSMIMRHLREKQEINFKREWPKDRGQGEPIEHIRTKSEPNLQNIPIKSELGREIRKKFDGETSVREYRQISGCCGEAED